MFDTILGLPVHALVVHAVVVLVPLCSLGVIICAISATWYDRLATATLVLLTLAVPSAFVAKLSGEELQARLPSNDQIQDHADLGSNAPLVVLAFWIIVAVWMAMRRSRGPDVTITKVLMVLSVVAAVGATGYVALVGDAGSRAVWEDIIESTNP